MGGAGGRASAFPPATKQNGPQMSEQKAGESSGSTRSSCSNASSVRIMRELSDTEKRRVDLAFDVRSAVARVRSLLDANLRPEQRAGLPRLLAYFRVLETISKEYPKICPVLLCWRIWEEDSSAALAYDSFLRRTPVSLRLILSTGVAPRWRSLHRCHASANGICRALLLENCGNAEPVCGAKFSASGDRIPETRGNWSLARVVAKDGE